VQPRTDLSSFPRALSLGPDEYVAWSARFDDDAQAGGTILASSERFRLAVDADVPTFIAEQVESQLESMRGQTTVPGLDGEAGAMAAKLLQAIEVKRTGSHLKGVFDLHEGPADQARDLGTVAALSIAGVRRYLVATKSAEARNSIGQIAKDYQAWWQREDGKRGRRKLASFPPVPKTVPRGTKYASTPEDWQAWAPLRFQLDAPQYYQYEVRASKDGSSADVIARGDLDGDGKNSEFRLHMALDHAHETLTIAPHIEERDPED
jgi:type IV pilus assembly protein PilA